MPNRMNPTVFSLRGDFFTPKVFRSLVAAELVRRLSPGRTQTPSPSECFHVRIPSQRKLLCLKSPFAKKPSDSFHTILRKSVVIREQNPWTSVINTEVAIFGIIHKTRVVPDFIKI